MDNYVTVSQLNRTIKNILDQEENLKNIRITGEISNLKIHQSGHWYFTLKDEFSRVNSVMFASKANLVKVKVKDGDKVNIIADLSVYEAAGNYQLYVNKLEPVGSGNLYLEFEKLKKKLAEEGLFKDDHKIALPKFPKTIGVISAPKGAVVKDIITTTRRRWPYAQIVVIPTLVQGSEAAKAIVAALKLADNMNFDVIICGRGGGSIEDLWPFNEEIVARQIYITKTPIVSAVGHETDYTIADFVADVRAPTPTAAAEMVTPNLLNIRKEISNLASNLSSVLINSLTLNRNKLKSIATKTVFTKPELIYANKRFRLDNLHTKIIKNQQILQNNTKNKLSNYLINMKNELTVKINHVNANLKLYNGKLNALGPNRVLERGYAIIKQENMAISSVKQIKLDQDAEVILKDGKVIVKPIKKG
jgi:exodeoxyribonuclease VII large subunit